MAGQRLQNISPRSGKPQKAGTLGHLYAIPVTWLNYVAKTREQGGDEYNVGLAARPTPPPAGDPLWYNYAAGDNVTLVEPFAY